MSKYQPLENHLRSQKGQQIPMTFGEIEHLIGADLPPSARKHRPWWSNNPSNSVITKAWLNAGYRTSRVDLQGETLVFERKERASPSAPAPSFSNMLGALKGKIRLAPGFSLCEPTRESWDAEADNSNE